MRRILLLLLISIQAFVCVNAQQVPGGFNYQSIVRDGIGLPVVNTSVSLRISILQGGPTGTIAYQETQNAVTNQFGLVNLVIGRGTVTAQSTVSALTAINWSVNDYFIQVEVNVNGNWISLGVTQFQSVPYALVSGNSLALQGIPVSNIAPLTNQLLLFDGTRWIPGNIAGANGGTMISVSGVGPITILGNANLDPQIAILQADANTNGYLSSNDWAVFSGKLGTSTGFGGNVAGTFGAITVTGLQGVPLSTATPVNGQVLRYNGVTASWEPQSLEATSWTLVGVDLYNQNTGNVGIGTTSANEKLTVFGNISASGSGFFSNAVLSGNAQMASAIVSGTTFLADTRTTNLTLTGVSPGYLTVDGLGRIGSGTVSISLSTTSPGVFVNGTTIDVATQNGLLATPGLLSLADYISFQNRLTNTNSPAVADVIGNFANGFTVVGIGSIPLNINSILPGQVISFNGISFVPGNVLTSSQITSITGINGVTVTGNDVSGFTIDGQNLTAGANITFTGNVISTHAPTPLTSITGVGILVSGANNNFTISGTTLATYTGDNVLTTLTGVFPNFTIAGIPQGSVFPTLTGINVTISGIRASPTIIGYNYLPGSGILFTSSGTDITIINALNISGDGITTSVTGINNNYTVIGLAGSSQWTTSGNNIYYDKGYIGIGNSNPLAQLHVNSSATGVAAFITSANSDNSLFANLYSGRTGYIYPGIGFSASSGGLGFGTLSSPTNEASYTPLMLLSNTGNLGIGTFSPNQRLAVVGNSSVTGIGYFGTLIGNNLLGAPLGSILTVDGVTGAIGYAGPSVNTDWLISTQSAIYTHSFVGIGTSTLTGGTTKLKVQGDMSGGGMLLASQSFVNELSTDQSAALFTLASMPVYIPQGTNSLRGNMIAFVSPVGDGEIAFALAGGPSAGLTITNISPALSGEIILPTNGLSGWHELVIRARKASGGGNTIIRSISVSIRD